MSKLIIAAAILLALFHQDFWWWNDVEPIILGMPIGLAYHVLFSLLAGGLWLLAIRYAWPHKLEEWAEGQTENISSEGPKTTED
ncbi:uncharacterized protein METZ01_LOCUS156515 [marine metagenome]|uniref:DUF3311 domain-containing protein n=1 Tax=marine metagenome TaxID=408172 RepID=A0A382AQT9_9ZZZZ|tara:strand:- start:1932 stop:2183 length:252 start_codon:yes stop_codon:yes gene_type:complete